MYKELYNLIFMVSHDVALVTHILIEVYIWNSGIYTFFIIIVFDGPIMSGFLDSYLE